jgi:hypothetical protein
MIRITLPNPDPVNGKKKICTHIDVLIKSDEAVVVTRRIDFIEDDGTAVTVQNSLQAQMLDSKMYRGSTVDQWVDPATGFYCESDAEGAIPEMDYLKSIPLAALPSDVTTIWGAIKWLIENSMLSGHLQNKY